MKKIITPLLMLVFLLSIACKKDESPANVPEGKTSLTVKLVGSQKTKAVGAPTQAQENAVHNIQIYVFKNNLLERHEEFTGGTLTQTIEDLTTGQKKVVVLANKIDGFPDFVIGDSYAKFAETTSHIDLDDQNDLTIGLLMTGENNVVLAASPAVNTVAVEVTRIVAKVKLGTVTLDPIPGHTGEFILQKVLITKAKSKSSVGLPASNHVTTPPFYGGATGPVVSAPNVKTYLSESITLAEHTGRHFYVFENDDATGNATLLTLVGTYDGQKTYFPFRINDDITGDGQYIDRNTEYTLNITIKRPGAGSTDPETPIDPADLIVTITTADWIVGPTQTIEW